MTQIISFLLSVVFIIDMFFVGLFPEKQLVITQTETESEYYVNGESDFLRFGVAGKGNLFEPNDEIKVIIECLDNSLDGTKAKISVTSKQSDFNKQGYFTFNSELPHNSFVFSSDKNGIFTIRITLSDNTRYSFNIGILPKNEQASNSFYYGIQPYITRAYTWGEGFALPGYSPAESVEFILDTAEYMGINLIREDSVGWGAMQTEPYGEVNFSVQDYLVNATNMHNMKYNWILGCNAGKWSINEKYKDNCDESLIWTYYPDEGMWSDFVQKVAEHYADNPDILWEIWNEPNWYFFSGTQEEYFSLLRKTATILKNQNSSAYVYSGGLALAEREEYLPYYLNFAELANENLIDNYGYHNHHSPSNYYNHTNELLALVNRAGLNCNGINSESGVNGADARLTACKALYTRSTGADGFVSFSFRKTATPENDINDYAFFNEYLQPTEAVISYATVIRFLGNAEFVKNVSDTKNLIIDEYSKDGNKIEVYYSLGKNTLISAPEGNYKAYDIYGNEITLGRIMTVSNSPVYIIYY